MLGNVSLFVCSLLVLPISALNFLCHCRYDGEADGVEYPLYLEKCSGSEYQMWEGSVPMASCDGGDGGGHDIDIHDGTVTGDPQ